MPETGFKPPFVAGRGAVALLAVVFILSACTTLNTNELVPDLRPSAVPVTVDTVGGDTDLKRLARAQNQGIINTYGGAYSDPQLELSVARIVGRLVAVSPDPEQTYSITILNSPQINAFALPGGYLYLTRGLLALANDSSELAAVIAHEMAHVLANHGVERQRLEAREALAGRIIAEVWQDETEARRSLLQGKLRLAQFSRAQELEADAIGIALMGKAGFDPYAAARFQRAMTAYGSFRRAGGETDGSLDFLASHPAAPQREALAEAKAREIGPPGTGTRDRDAYLAGLEGVLYGDPPEEGYVRGSSFLHPGLGIAFSVPAGFDIDNTAEAVLATGPGDAAVRFDGAKLPATTPLDVYLKSGWVTGLDPASVKSFGLGGLEAASAQATARGWRFDITVIRVGDGVYRILTAVPRGGDPETVAGPVRNSFRTLSADERAAIKPLTVRVITARAGDTQASLAAQMTGVDRAAELLRLLNGFGPATAISAGQKVKIISSQ
jgi:predicted Zn-dependent protease